MDIYKDKAFRNTIVNFLSLVKNNLDQFSLTQERVELTEDEIFARVNNVVDDLSINKVLQCLKDEKILSSYSIRENVSFSSDFGSFKTKIYVLSVHGNRLEKFLKDFSENSNTVKFSEINSKKIVRNKITLDLENGILSYEGNKITVNTNNSIKLLAILMANKNLLTFNEIYKDLDIGLSDFENKSMMNGNLRKIKSEMCSMLEKIGVCKDDVNKMILRRNKIGLIMKDI